jgi:hypothetical protein
MWCALFRDVFRTSPFACSMHLYIRTHSHKRNWSCGIYTHTQINCCVHTYTCCTDHSKFPIYSHLNWLNSPLIRVYTCTNVCTTCGVFSMHLSRSTCIATTSQTVIKSRLLEIQLLEVAWELCQRGLVSHEWCSHCVCWEFGSVWLLPIALITV